MGLRERMKQAASLEQVMELAREGETFTMMSRKTRNRIERTMSVRIAQLKKGAL